LNGQVIRSNSILTELEKALPVERVCRLSYHTWKKRPFHLLHNFVKLMRNSERIILFPDLRAIHVLIPLALILRKVFGTKVYYNVIGGWISEYVEGRPDRAKRLGKLDGIFVQTKVLQKVLNSVGVEAVTVFPNFKYTKVYSLAELPYTAEKPYRLVFMSRIVEKKGVTQMVQRICSINDRHDTPLFILDIYGSVQQEYKQEFNSLMKDAPEYIRYCGQVDPNKTSSVMVHYFLHVFPTLYKTEGFPGSVLDAFCGGCPTIAARWNSFDDVLTDGQDCISFELGNWDDFEEKLLWAAEHPEKIADMRETCLQHAELYSPDKVIQIMLKEFVIENSLVKGNVQ